MSILFVLFISNYAYDFIELVCYDNNKEISSFLGDYESENNNEKESEKESETEETDTFDEFLAHDNLDYTSNKFTYFSLLDFNRSNLFVYIDIPIPPPKA